MIHTVRSHFNSSPVPRVSIVCAAYNAEQTVLGVVRSVLAQTDSRFELILVDDGSTDSTNKLCCRACKSDSRVSLISSSHVGRVLARTKGMAASKGSYVIVIDSDDFCAPNLVETIIAATEKHNAPDIVVFNYSLLGKNSKNGLSQISPGFFCESDLVFPRKWLLFNYYNPLWRKAIRREIVLKDGAEYCRYNHPMGEDLLMSLTFFDLARTVLIIPDVLYLYRPVATSPMYAKGFFQKRFNPFLFERKLFFAHRWGFDNETILALWREALTALVREFELFLGLFGKKVMYSSVRNENWLAFVHPNAGKMIALAGLSKRNSLLLIGLRKRSPAFIRMVLLISKVHSAFRTSPVGRSVSFFRNHKRKE